MLPAVSSLSVSLSYRVPPHSWYLFPGKLAFSDWVRLRLGFKGMAHRPTHTTLCLKILCSRTYCILAATVEPALEFFFSSDQSHFLWFFFCRYWAPNTVLVLILQSATSSFICHPQCLSPLSHNAAAVSSMMTLHGTIQKSCWQGCRSLGQKGGTLSPFIMKENFIECPEISAVHFTGQYWVTLMKERLREWVLFS